MAGKLLLEWYAAARRDLPWRRTRDPWRILVSEVMLQQTRVAAVIPYYERFVERFPTPASLAAASEREVLACWSGLGYYSRARNLQKAAAAIAAQGGFPASYAAMRALPGVGDYTAAAIASICHGEPYAVLDGNVIRVLARLTGEREDTASTGVRVRLKEAAQRMLDHRRPGDYNQALMELGATLCLPQKPQCLLCPWREICRARAEGLEQELPVKGRRRRPVKLEIGLVVVSKAGKILLRQRGPGEPRLAGFWELPEKQRLPVLETAEQVGSFRHSITHHDYDVAVWRAGPVKAPKGHRWFASEALSGLPLSTMSRKALELARVYPAAPTGISTTRPGKG